MPTIRIKNFTIRFSTNEKDMKSNWVAKASAVDEIKIFDNDYKATKHSERKGTFCGLVIIIKNFTAGGLGYLIWFHIFFIQASFNSWPLLFYTRGVLVEISLVFLEICTSYIHKKPNVVSLIEFFPWWLHVVAVQRKADVNYSYSNDCSPFHKFYSDLKIL